MNLLRLLQQQQTQAFNYLQQQQQQQQLQQLQQQQNSSQPQTPSTPASSQPASVDQQQLQIQLLQQHLLQQQQQQQQQASNTATGTRKISIEHFHYQRVLFNLFYHLKLLLLHPYPLHLTDLLTVISNIKCWLITCYHKISDLIHQAAMPHLLLHLQ
jgi:hypothetical protein